MTKKEKQSIDFARRFALPPSEINESIWRRWVPDKEVDLGEKIEIVKRYADRPKPAANHRASSPSG